MIKSNLAEEKLCLKYWQAVDTFGQLAVDSVINDPDFCLKYPKLVKKINEVDSLSLSGIILSGEIIYEIAGYPKCLYDFYVGPKRFCLYPSVRGEDYRKYIKISGVKKISTQQALLKYGARCLFEAIDVGCGFLKTASSFQCNKV